MDRRLLIGAAVGVAATAAVAHRRTLHRWAAQPDPLGGTEPRFPTEHHHTVRIDDGAEIFVVEAGRGPSVVLVHGLTGNHDDWGPVADRLVADGFRVLAVDQRGHGGSTVGREGFGVERQAADLAQVLVALDVRDALVVGHSMGGMAAMGLAVHDPEVTTDRVAGLVIVASAAALDQRVQRLQMRIGRLRPIRALGRRPEWFPVTVGRTSLGAHPSRALVDATVRSYRQCPESTRRDAATGITAFDLTAALESVPVPAVVVCGDHDRLTPLQSSEVITARLPEARLEVVPDAGHMVIWEAVHHLCDVVVDFASEVQRGERSISGSGT